jgi:hypothetical protein
VLAHLAPPVGELGDPPAQRLDGVRELLALALDVGADLGRAPTRRAGGRLSDRFPGATVDLGLAAQGAGSWAGGAGAWAVGVTGSWAVGATGSLAAGVVPASSVCLIRRPSSIARSGVGGEPFCTASRAM